MSDLLRHPGPPEPVPHVDPPQAQDPRFTEVVPRAARLVSLYDQATFSEGPTWWPARGILVLSDVEGRRVLGWHPDGCFHAVIDATPFIDGDTVDGAGDLIHCEHGNRRISRTRRDGRYEVVVETDRAKRFNARDDVICAADALWFTDPRTSVVDGDCRSWDVPNLWVCDGSVFPTTGGVNPSLTIQAVALRTADRIRALARGKTDRRG